MRRAEQQRERRGAWEISQARIALENAMPGVQEAAAVFRPSSSVLPRYYAGTAKRLFEAKSSNMRAGKCMFDFSSKGSSRMGVKADTSCNAFCRRKSRDVHPKSWPSQMTCPYPIQISSKSKKVNDALSGTPSTELC